MTKTYNFRRIFKSGMVDYEGISPVSGDTPALALKAKYASYGFNVVAVLPLQAGEFEVVYMYRNEAGEMTTGKDYLKLVPAAKPSREELIFALDLLMHKARSLVAAHGDEYLVRMFEQPEVIKACELIAREKGKNDWQDWQDKV